MSKLLNLIPLAGLSALLFFCQTNTSSCTKNKTITDTVTKIVKDTLTVTDTIPVVNLKNGLIAYYPFNGNAGDSSGNNNVSTVFGNLQYSTDMNNQADSAALFDGTSNYIVVNDNGSLSPASLTISVRIYENSSSLQQVIAKFNISSNALSPVWSLASFGGANVTAPAFEFVALGPGAPCGSTDPITSDQLVSTGGAINTGQWYQLVCIFDQGVEKIYLNGALKGAQTFNYQTLKQCTDAQLVIGCWYEEGFHFSGKMDELRIYNRALNDREIQQLASGF